MRMRNYGAMAALGITRVGDNATGIVRQISMAGFGGLPQGDAPNPNHESNVNPNTGCPKTTSRSTYCGCMYGDKDRISTDKKGSGDFSNGSARWACQTSAELNLIPWTCEGILSTVTLSLGKADPLRHMGMNAKLAEYKRCAEKIGRDVGPVLDLLKATGALPMDTTPTAAQPASIEAAQPTPYTGARPLNPYYFMSRPVMPVIPDPATLAKVAAKSAIPTGLLVGGGLAVVAALFLLKK